MRKTMTRGIRNMMGRRNKMKKTKLAIGEKTRMKNLRWAIPPGIPPWKCPVLRKSTP